MQTHYTPTKAGVLSLMQSCAIALGPHNIRCNAVLPGTIETANDSLVTTYPVPATVCSLSVAAVSSAYTQVVVNGTTVAGPNTQFDSSTAANACTSAGSTASIEMFTTRS